MLDGWRMASAVVTVLSRGRRRGDIRFDFASDRSGRPDDLKPPVFAALNAVCTIVGEILPFPRIDGTYEKWAHLQKNKDQCRYVEARVADHIGRMRVYLTVDVQAAGAPTQFAQRKDRLIRSKGGIPADSKPNFPLSGLFHILKNSLHSVKQHRD